MARPVSTILKSLIQNLPNGWALGMRGGVLDAVLSSFAVSIGTIEQDAEELMRETDPRAANALLPDFERCLGPDPCERDTSQQTLEQRQRIAHQRWTARGGQSIPYMIEVAAKLGVDITIEEFWPSTAGGLRAGQRLLPEGSQFVWRINVPGLVNVVKFRTGVSQAGHRLGTFTLSEIECELRRIKPAHTHVVFAYGDA
ncbi:MULTISPECIES: YmfQ family protein [unclassified Rhizobium]|uniref:YmfQ family protein n=1 Tax=unclassified Rhizobium TaxID=2613769 RepID=UPI001781CA44|nr:MULTISPECIES: putative phage tail protein [unclassified Rhizobium]MBD8686564.1 DUF2313 domain-containing protein [Rhizobium sp. CFBP 13644]MBD8691634.1 DUF2313 domain-containing protein [Rhizobium sp. CFBP 13717]